METIPSRLLHASGSFCRLATWVVYTDLRSFTQPLFSDWTVIHVVRVHVMWPITRPVPRESRRVLLRERGSTPLANNPSTTTTTTIIIIQQTPSHSHTQQHRRST